MCIIVHKPAGVKWEWKELKECFDRNKHGAGYMVHEGDYVLIDKGYFEWDGEKGIRAALEKVEEAEAVAHFRISTGGGVNAGNCHPYPITTDEKMLAEPSCITAIGLAHNGMLDYNGGGGEDTAVFSDTALLVRDIIAPVIKAQDAGLFNNLLTYIAEESKSKLCIMGNGIVLRYGKGWVEEKGIHYSNYGFRVYTKPVVTGGVGKGKGSAWRSGKNNGKGRVVGNGLAGTGAVSRIAGYDYGNVHGGCRWEEDEWDAIRGSKDKESLYKYNALGLRPGDIVGGENSPRRVYVREPSVGVYLYRLMEAWECSGCENKMYYNNMLYEVDMGRDIIDLCSVCYVQYERAIDDYKEVEKEAGHGEEEEIKGEGESGSAAWQGDDVQAVQPGLLGAGDNHV